MKPTVIQTEHLDARWADWLDERAGLVRCNTEDERFYEHLAHARALIVRTYTMVDEELLARAPKLEVIGRAGVGLDNIDLRACAERGVRVVHTPDANSVAVVELVLAFIFDALRPRVFLDRAIPKEEWMALRNELLAPRQLSQVTLGIMGLGRIGSRLARAAAPLFSRVIYHDLREIPDEARHGAEPVSDEALFAESDVLSVHIDNRPSNRHALGAFRLERMKPKAVLINASRGFVLDHESLARRLKAEPEMAALLDVHDPEPIDADNPLLGIPNAHLSPHIAASTALAHENMSRVVEDVWRVMKGEPPVYEARADDMIG